MPNSSVVPSMAYRNAPEAIEWLCRVFGFEKHAVYPGPDNTILHSELTLGGGMIMLGSAAKDGPFSALVKHPDELGGVETHTINLVVDDADVVYARAQAAGAQIVFEIKDQHYGGRSFTCRDLEGRLWNVGTYDPWQPK
jgi:uncharacterized glyoxalase superfamily protein PhnB